MFSATTEDADGAATPDSDTTDTDEAADDESADREDEPAVDDQAPEPPAEPHNFGFEEREAVEDAE